MRYLASALLLLLLGGCITYDDCVIDKAGGWCIPKQFVKPTRTMHIQRVSPAKLAEICSISQSKVACSWVMDNDCMVYIRNDLNVSWTRGARFHERAHCNGWPGHHPIQ
jgi:hypothetical protein